MFQKKSFSAPRRLRLLACGVTVAAVVGGGAVGPAHADDVVLYIEPDVVTEVLEDAASGVIDGDAVVASAEGVNIVIPTELDEPVTIESGGVTAEVTLPQAEEVATAVDAEAASVVHTREDGASVIPLAREDGVLQVLSVIPDSVAPTSFEYAIDATGLASLVQTPNGGAIGVDAAGDAVVEVAAPWALDASGSPVSTTFEVTGDKLIQHVDTSGLSADQYPVVADPAITVTSYVYKYVTLSRVSNWTNKSEQLGICKVERGAGGGTCTISASYTLCTGVDVAFGLSKSVVSANVGVNLSETVSGSVSWTSPRAPVGSTYKAWAVGKRVTYMIEKYKVVKAGGRTISTLHSTSATLTAFQPVKGFAIGQ